MATGRIGTTPVLTTRWSKAPAGGTTSLSGTDDNSVTLIYSVGYEAVYRNGVLLSRGNDYTAANGTTITLIDATITGDIIEVFANATVPLTDTYSQSVADGKFINNTLTTTTGDIIYASAANTPARLGIGSTGNVLTVSGGVPAWAAPSTPSFIGVSLNSAGQTIATGTDTVRNFSSEFFDTDAYHDNSTNNSRITIPSGKGGKYLIIAANVWAPYNGSFRRLRVRKNGSTLLASYDISSGNGAAGDSYYLSTIKDLVATDYIEVLVRQDSGGNLTSEGGEGYTYFAAYYLGA